MLAMERFMTAPIRNLRAHGVAQLEHVGVAHHVKRVGAGAFDFDNAIGLRDRAADEAGFRSSL